MLNSPTRHLVLRSAFALAGLGLLFGVATQASAQEGDAEQPYVYSSYWKIPWDRVDSLTKLNKLYPVVAKAKELGTIVNRVWLVHHTGNEYNVVISTVFSSWEAMGQGARIGQAFRALEPDSLRRAEINAGYGWVFDPAVTSHYDIIYRLMESP
jgi:hypothetical protein